MWVVIAWLIALVVIALAKVYLPARTKPKPPLIVRIISIFAMVVPPFVAFKMASGTLEQGSFLLSSAYLFGISLGGLAIGAAIVKLIISALGREAPIERNLVGEDTDEVMLNGKPLDDL